VRPVPGAPPDAERPGRAPAESGQGSANAQPQRPVKFPPPHASKTRAVCSVLNVDRERGTAPERRSRRPAQLLGALDGALAGYALAYVVFRPVSLGPATIDAFCALAFLLLAPAAVWLSPKLPRWFLDALIAATWLLLVVLTATRVATESQVLLALPFALVAIYCAYFMPPRRAAWNVGLMVVGYLGAIFLTGPTPTFFAVTAALLVLAVAWAVSLARRADTRYRLLADYSADVVIQSRNGKVDWISTSVYELLGRDPGELVGTSTLNLWHPDDQEALVALRDQAAAGEVSSAELRLCRRDGEHVWVDAVVRPYTDSHGISGAVISVRDVSARIAAEHALVNAEREQRELAERLAAVSAAQSRFFQGISHEFRTPISVIRLPLSRLAAGSSPDPRQVAAAVRAADHLRKLVDDLLDVARGRSGRLLLQGGSVNVRTVADDVFAMFAPICSSAGLELVLDMGDLPENIDADGTALTRILTNLLSNAVRFTPEGTVTLRVEHHDGCLYIRVSDTGVGIPKDELPQLLERFYQGSIGAVRGGHGTGLGLSLVHELTQAAGGSCSVSSTVGKGTTFSVEMPARALDSAGVTSLTELGANTASVQRLARSLEPSRVSQVDGHRGRILVVEDDDDLRAAITGLLGDAGWAATSVPDVETARPLVSEHDLVVSDVKLPGEDGLALVEWIRAQDTAVRSMPIMLLTARVAGDEVVAGLNAGADDYVTKPFDATELLARISTHVELAHLRRALLGEAEEKAEHMQKALSSNRTIGTAIGVLMALHHVTSDQAFDMLREESQRSNVKLRDVAESVVFTGALPVRS
jgi:PAS domain S-box-containing protein